TYRGMADLLDRTHSHGRARAARQVLRVLNCEVEDEATRAKTEPTRLIEPEQISEYLLPAHLDTDVLEVLRTAMPLVEKVWGAELPQKKALDGVRLDKLDAIDAYDSLEAALESFGIDRFRAEAGDSGPKTPVVLGGSSTHVWLNFDEIDRMDAATLRFVAGYCAGLAWSELSPLLTIDGRRVWHLLEAVLLKQTGSGFGERVDVTTQQLVERISSPFDTVARRRLHSALEPHIERFADIPCERWPKAVERFASRCGLAVCGDVPAAVRGMLRFHGWELPLDAPETQQQIRRNGHVRDLIGFALDDDYLEARYALGLSARPREIVR
ncbi:MAG: hypothetical protein ACOCV2_14675, partial [Persicimonas sp.]